MDSLTFPIKNSNWENQYDYYIAGYSYTVGDVLSCEGGKAILDGQFLSQTLIHNHDTVVVKDRKVIVDKRPQRKIYRIRFQTRITMFAASIVKVFWRQYKKKWDGEEAYSMINKPTKTCELFTSIKTLKTYNKNGMKLKKLDSFFVEVIWLRWTSESPWSGT